MGKMNNAEFAIMQMLLQNDDARKLTDVSERFSKSRIKESSPKKLNESPKKFFNKNLSDKTKNSKAA